VIRTFILSAHYSSPVTYSEEAMNAARTGWERLVNAARLTRRKLAGAPENDDGSAFTERLEAARADFKAAMDDDFNAPRALAVLQELTRDVNSLLNSEQSTGRPILEAIDQTYRQLGGEVLGIIPEGETASRNGAREEKLIELLIDLRARAREQKDYTESDRIRDELAALGVVLEDRADGTIWKLT
jgi:cysteinyl-tRNA synthetase